MNELKNIKNINLCGLCNANAILVEKHQVQNLK